MMTRVSLALFFCFASTAHATIERVEPPNWWVGMADPTLQLMVYGDGIGHASVSVNDPRVEVVGTQRVENPNYLFVDLRVDDSAGPGAFDLQFKDLRKATQTVSYMLHARVPDSAERSGFDPSDVIYLVTPDRFANGDPTNDSLPGFKEGSSRGNPDGRHGGDLQGLAENIDYLADLGFTQLWLNPVLENDQPQGSYHGYAATDLYAVDERFGGNAAYLELTAAMRARGMGMIQDIVLNHIGSEHWWMDDLPSADWINHGGQFAPTSHRRETLHDPHRAESDLAEFQDGWFVPTMPDLNQRQPQMATYLIQYTIWWIEMAGLSGLRIDTYPYPDKDFLSIWSRRVMREYPNLNIVGEEWTLNPALVAYWQKGSPRYDKYETHTPSMMDFPLQHALVSALNDEESWDRGLIALYNVLANDFLYGDPYQLVVFGDNHDMSRIFSQLHEDEARFRMAMAVLATMRGIPQIFYGTEILMKNPGTDAHGIIRSDYPGGWPGDAVNAFTGAGLTPAQARAHDLVRDLLNWRKTATAIHDGKLTHYAPRDGVYVYFRENDAQRIMVLLNKNGGAWTIGTDRFAAAMGGATQGVDVLTGQTHDLRNTVRVPARSALILELGE